MIQEHGPAGGAVATVRRHLDAVRRGNPEAMAADYADDAVLVRGEDRYVGRDQIARYFTSVPGRLGGGVVDLRMVDSAEGADGAVEVAWRIRGGPADGTSGTDRFLVRDDRILHQQVRVAGDDF